MLSSNWQMDLAFEVVRAIVVGAIVAFLMWSGASRRLHRLDGWRTMVIGFGLVFVGTLFDITDNFASLNRFIVVGDTVVEAFIEKEVGYLLGVVLIFAGYRRWLPAVERRTQELEAEIARRELAETDRREVEAQLLQSQRLDMLGRLASGVAHDFNNILTAIVGHAWLIRRDLSKGIVEPTKIEKSVGQVNLAARRGEALADQLLIFSRHEHDDPRFLDPGIVLADLESMLERLVPAGIALAIGVSSRVRRIFADLHQFEQVVVNLVVNARDAMPDGGTVHLAVEDMLVHANDCPPELEPGNFVRFSVQDTGTGIGPDTLERIFEPFFTTKQAGQGTGLGMSTVRSIVEKFGGFVTVETEVGEGTTIAVFMPGMDAASTPLPTEESLESAAPVDATILVCEDDPNVRALLLQVFEDAGYRVRAASHAITAMTEFAECRGEVDLLVSALVISGGMTGPELADALQARRPGLRVLFTTGYGDEALSSMGIEPGETPVVSKPFNLPILLAAVRDRLDRDQSR